MSASSPETSLSSSSSRDDEELWEDNPPTSMSRLNSLDCWDYTIELECLGGTKGVIFFQIYFRLSASRQTKYCITKNIPYLFILTMKMIFCLSNYLRLEKCFMYYFVFY